jgi:radical SAM-linked protein
MARSKFRIRFQKGGDLRLISHHDLMRSFERMLRRGGLPFSSTQGFNPKPRLTFALSLAVGVAGLAEVAELLLEEQLACEEVHRVLEMHAPAGLSILSVCSIDVTVRAHVQRVGYRVTLSPTQLAGLLERCAELLAASEFVVQRRRPRPRHIDLRAYIRNLEVLPAALEMDIWVRREGTVRPEEILGALGLADFPDAGLVIERIMVELEDECPARAAGDSSPQVPLTSAAREMPATDIKLALLGSK